MEALEWALALSKAPSERIALRQRPLPGGMLELLQIAAGSGTESLAHVAGITREDPEHIREAARFYIREVLFHQGADAYRVLGVEHDGSAETLRAHHRLLQRWLHPDRQTSDWDAIFAARVNAAWSQLRSEDRRAAYDLEHPPRSFSHARAPSSAMPWHVADGAVHASADPARWRRRMPTLALFATCAVLGLLAIRELQPEPQRDIPNEAVASAVIHIPAVLQPAPAVRPGLSAAPRGAGSPVAAQRPTKTSPRAMTAVAPVAPVAPVGPVEPARADVGLPANVPDIETITVRTPKPVQATAAAKDVARVTAAPAAGKQAQAPLANIARVAPPALPEPARSGGTNAPAHRRVADSVRPVASEDAGVSAGVPLARVQDAQDVGGHLIRFMTSAGSATPPIWASLNAQRGASQLRDHLVGQGPPRMEAPHWRIGDKVAAMHAVVRFADGNAGRLSADLVWREQRWLVTGLSVERDR